jgi:hypothetical protein
MAHLPDSRQLVSLVTGGVAALAFVLSCGNDNAATTADAGEESCGTCTIPSPVSVTGEVTIGGPVAIAQPVQVRTADTDLNQLVSGGKVPASYGQKLVDGPIIVTDVMTPATHTITSASRFRASVYIDATPPIDCTEPPTFPLLVVERGPDWNMDIHGARIPVKAGEALCAQQIAEGSLLVTWSGFRPY